MASVGEYSYPYQYYAWTIEGDDLIIVTDYPSTDNAEGDWISPQETVTDGILISYQAEPDAVTAVTDSLDLDNTLHKYILEYVMAELWRDEAGRAIMKNNSEKAVLCDRAADAHEKRAKDILVKYGMKSKDKIGGQRRVIPQDFR